MNNYNNKLYYYNSRCSSRMRCYNSSLCTLALSHHLCRIVVLIQRLLLGLLCMLTIVCSSNSSMSRRSSFRCPPPRQLYFRHRSNICKMSRRRSSRRPPSRQVYFRRRSNHMCSSSSSSSNGSSSSSRYSCILLRQHSL